MGPRLQKLALCGAGLLLATGAFAQQDQTPHPWRSANNDSAQAATPPDMTPDSAQANPAPPPPNFSSAPANLPNPNTPLPQQQQPYGQQPYGQQPYGGYNNPAPMAAVPAHLTVKPGTFVTIRMSQGISSDHAQQGDTFIATLAEPLVVDGVVVAQRGETVYGRVTEAQKAGRVEGTSKLGVELTGLTLVDGQQVSVQSQMINRNGSTSVGRDAGAIAGTTALGAAIGAGADWGRGAAIGAGAGAIVGIAGVLLTRGHATVIYPEQVLTFRVQSPVDIATDRAPQAFRYVTSQDYNRGPSLAQRPGAPGPGYAAAPPPPGYYGPAYYPNPYYWGPGFSVYVGPRFYGYRRWR
jgi:hypothetical protein